MRHTPITPKSQYKAIWWISLCIGEDDEELVSELQTAKEVWQELKKKYADNQATGRKLLKQYFSFQKAEDMSIDGAWTHLQALGKRIKVAQPEMAAAINPKARAQVLLSGLPEQWSTIRDAIDGQPSLSPESILSILQEKECPPITCDDTRLRNNYQDFLSSLQHPNLLGQSYQSAVGTIEPIHSYGTYWACKCYLDKETQQFVLLDTRASNGAPVSVTATIQSWSEKKNRALWQVRLTVAHDDE
ncbi:hypothetical protein CKM354_000904800 [Cercospora kikuchii]|uniref:Uncharacterized protein n=1 Tax=Cercospora kikuchii TaxID=84275 RepID=A0A9P3FK37_9PEZI|nr:uncharacterized protein CKM354_000904800 [Cercospora kikuchii]GIZ45900.1 hypothetical protein CKM354_000904800 [Cercospora kikuchii]